MGLPLVPGCVPLGNGLFRSAKRAATAHLPACYSRPFPGPREDAASWLTGLAGAAGYFWTTPQAGPFDTLVMGLLAVIFLGLPLVFFVGLLVNAYESWFR